MNTSKDGEVLTANSSPAPPRGGPDKSAVESLQGIPASLQAGIEHANRLLSQSATAASEGDIEIARIRAEQGLKVVRVLATSMPQFAALLMASAGGHNQIEEEVYIRKDRFYPEDVKFLGITVAKTMQHEYTTERHVRTERLK